MRARCAAPPAGPLAAWRSRARAAPCSRCCNDGGAERSSDAAWRARQARTPLLDALQHRADDGASPFHVPGHQARARARVGCVLSAG
jgi:hypothetical protein